MVGRHERGAARGVVVVLLLLVVGRLRRSELVGLDGLHGVQHGLQHVAHALAVLAHVVGYGDAVAGDDRSPLVGDAAVGASGALGDDEVVRVIHADTPDAAVCGWQVELCSDAAVGRDRRRAAAVVGRFSGIGPADRPHVVDGRAGGAVAAMQQRVHQLVAEGNIVGTDLSRIHRPVCALQAVDDATQLSG